MADDMNAMTSEIDDAACDITNPFVSDVGEEDYRRFAEDPKYNPPPVYQLPFPLVCYPVAGRVPNRTKYGMMAMMMLTLYDPQ